MKTDPEFTYHPSVSRRQVLRGVGATLTLPWLPSLATAQRDKPVENGPPRRWASMVFANGVNVDHWWAKGDGEDMELSSALSPLAPHRADIMPIDGLRLFEERLFPVHVPYFTNFLSGGIVENCVVAGSKGKQPGGDGRDPRIPDVAQSLDHYLASKIGHLTPVPCLTLGIEAPSYGIKAGRPQIYYDTISWSDRQTPIAPEIYPRAAFDQLFDVSALVEKRSVLDTVYGQAKSLGHKINHADREKLDEYMEGIREIERRIDVATSEGRLEGWQPSLSEPDMSPPPHELPQNIPEHMKLMIDIMILGFRMDKTRIATLQFNNDGTNYMKFGFLDGVPNKEHHGISHHGGDPDRKEHHCRTIRYHSAQLAYFMERMKSIDEGGVSMLDNSSILFGTNFIDGHHHDVDSVPLIAAGGKNTIRGGRVISAEREMDRPACNLYLAMLHRMGVPSKSFGDSAHPLKQLS